MNWDEKNDFAKNDANLFCRLQQSKSATAIKEF